MGGEEEVEIGQGWRRCNGRRRDLMAEEEKEEHEERTRN